MLNDNFYNITDGIIDQRVASLDQLKKSNLPVVLYGAGDYSKAVEAFLNKHGLKISGKFVDQNFERSDLILSFDDIERKYEKYNLVIGMADYQLGYAQILQKKSKKINFSCHFVVSPLFLDALNLNLFNKHIESYEKVYSFLCDQESRDSYIAFIKTQLSGDDSFIKEQYCSHQYFQNFLRINDQEIFVDVGAFTGDTLIEFYNFTKGNYLKYYAFEPDNNNFERLSNYVNDNKIPRVELFCSGIGQTKEIVRFSENSGDKSRVNKDGGVFVQINTIDDLCADATFIKIDIEGAELEAINGGAKVLKEKTPKLAIAAYHNPLHLFEIPLLVKSISPSYKLYFRQHQKISTDLVMYAINK